jgi:hypothetical protein
MSEQGALSVKIARSLESAGIPFMIVGSIASITYSQPRFTNDVDIVIDPNAAQLSAWVSDLGDRFYASQEMAQEALRHRSMFNIIDLTTGLKVDLIIRKQRPFDIEQLQRRVPRNVEGALLQLATAEDIILAKLEWNKITPSERQLRDVQGVAVMQLPTLDLAYLRKWAPELGVAAELEDVLRIAEEMQDRPAP